MRILLVNRTLAGRTGTETYSRDLALGLLRTGHRPTLFSPFLGELAEELRAAAIPVTDDVTAIGEAPDVIHGHHRVQTLAALARFPGVPAVFVCHDASEWQASPPHHPRVRCHAAVDDGCRDRLVQEHGIAPSRCVWIPNAVDANRFPARGSLPERPRRALLFGHELSEASIACVDSVCGDRGITVDRAGAGLGHAVAAPEDLLGGYDLVFAKGRCALEAMAVGAAVIVCGPEGAGSNEGIGGMVSSGELDEWRSTNFGRRAYRWPFDAANLAAQVDRYDAKDAEHVSQRIRTVAGLDALCASFVELYEEAMCEERAAPASPDEEARAFGQAFASLGERWEDSLAQAMRRRREARRARRDWRRIFSRAGKRR